MRTLYSLSAIILFFGTIYLGVKGEFEGLLGFYFVYIILFPIASLSLRVDLI